MTDWKENPHPLQRKVPADVAEAGYPLVDVRSDSGR